MPKDATAPVVKASDTPVIVRVECLPLQGTPLGGSWQERISDGRGEQLHTLVRLTADDGSTGLGSCFTSAQLVASAVELMRPLILGASAVDPAAVAERLHQSTFWPGRGGAVTHAVSGLDIALWDVFGQITRQPISRLLGGRFRDRIKPYGSLLMGDPPETVDKLAAGLERGFRAFKLGWGPFGRQSSDVADEAIVAAARDAVGDDVSLMLDAGGSEEFWPHGYKWALRTSQMLAAHGIEWFEEPLRPDDIDGYIRLTEHAPVPIAAGEVLTRRQSFAQWVERRASDYIQPDVTKVGGITEQHQIARHAYDHGVLTVPHGWNTGVGLAADLQLVAAAVDARWVEYMTPAEYIDPMFAEPLKIDGEGFLEIPDGPGLGVAWDTDGIEALTVAMPDLATRWDVGRP